MIDNHIYWGNALDIDTRRVVWRRVMDMNDRALRDVVASLGGVANGFPRQGGFDITVASEVMAILCLASDLKDLEKRLGDMIVAYRRDRSPVFARDLKADGAMTVLLKDAMQPNLVQTLENNPAFVHGGPFANIAHGCNSVIATTTALRLADFVVTEAGFGADLGAEKFMDIKCRKAGLAPDCVVVVATVRALKMNGGVAKADLGAENVDAVTKGCENLARHIDNLKGFGVPVVVAINHFVSDTEAEVAAVKAYACRRMGRRRSSAGTGRKARRGSRSWRRGWPRSPRRGVGLPHALSRRDGALREDRDDRHADLPRRRGRGGREDPGAAEGVGGAGLWAPAGLHGQDPVFLHDRPERARRARRAFGAGARGAAVGRGGLRRGDLRGDHDDARPAQGAGGRDDPAECRRRGRGAVLRRTRLVRPVSLGRGNRPAETRMRKPADCTTMAHIRTEIDRLDEDLVRCSRSAPATSTGQPRSRPRPICLPGSRGSSRWSPTSGGTRHTRAAARVEKLWRRLIDWSIAREENRLGRQPAEG
jgi:hypothetical protein